MSKKISELTDAATLDGTEQIELVQAGGNVKATVNDLLPVQLQGDKEIDLNGHDLNLESDEEYFLLIQPSVFRAQIQAIGQGSSYSLLDLGANSDDNIRFDLQSFDGTHTVELKGDAAAETMTYTATNHVFEGLGDFVNDGAAETGGVPVGGLYHTSGTVKIRLA
jgi:hypothetical protein